MQRLLALVGPLPFIALAILAAGLERGEAQQLAENLERALLSLQQTGASDCLPVAHIGLTAFAPGDESQDLYRALDTALAQAASQGSNSGLIATIKDARRRPFAWRGLSWKPCASLPRGMMLIDSSPLPPMT